MSTTKNWVIALDLTSADHALIRFTHELLHYFSPGKIYFVHVINNDENPDYSGFYQINQHLQKSSEERLIKFISTHFHHNVIDFSVHVLLGDLVEQFLIFSRKHQVDLIMMAKKSSNGLGILIERLSKKIESCMMIVPESFDQPISKIMVPTDFSEHALLAMRYAADFLDRNLNLSLCAYHVTQIPPMAFLQEMKHHELINQMLQKAQENMQRFIGPFRSFVNNAIDLQEEIAVPDLILQKAKQSKVDLIMIGSKGHNHSPVLLMGSATFKLLKINFTIPMLIVKRPEENREWMKILQS